VAIAHFGVQGADQPTPLDAWFAEVRDLPDGPENVDIARFVDSSGEPSRLYLAYWTDADRFGRWVSSPDVERWWTDDARLIEGVGYWSETYVLPGERMETIWSSPEVHGTGIRPLADVTGPVRNHGYWGSMRDRLPASSGDPLDSPLGDTFVPRRNDTRGRRIRIAPPPNLCVIRSGQDWSRCTGEERITYVQEVMPVLAEGMRFLMDNPAETGCISCRFTAELDASGRDADRAFALAHFQTLGHLEAWAKSHPTHLRIFAGLMDMIGRHGADLSLRLHHEVFVTAEGGDDFEYINCHDRTGILPLYKQRSGESCETAPPG
jgi:hypothetical protein